MARGRVTITRMEGAGPPRRKELLSVHPRLWHHDSTELSQLDLRGAFIGLAAFGRTLTRDPGAVTCGHCRKTAAWQEAAGRGPGVVHFAGGGGRWSCRPWDMVMSGTVTLAAAEVTCGNCRRTPALRQAEAEGARPEWAAALDELLGGVP